MSATTTTRDGITLTCSPEKDGDSIVFAYILNNGGRADAYVSDAELKIDPATNTASADPNGVAIWRGEDGYAHVLKGVATLPVDRTTPGRVMPLMVRLGAGEQISRRLVLQMPLAEHSPYYGIGNLREYRLADIDGVRLLIDILPVPDPSFTAKPVPYADGYFDVGVRNTIPLMVRMSCDFRARGLHVMVRHGSYVRPD
jgi:hypothetical protein